MKSILKITLILAFNSLLGFISQEADAQCVDLVHYYYQCKNLKMVDRTMNNISPSYDSYYSYNEIYVPDPTVDNNTINDSFYQRLKLEEKNFDWAMELFHKIYAETDNCTSQFCICMNKTLNLYKDFKPFFRNEKIVLGIKQIIKPFFKKYNSGLLSYNEIIKKVPNNLFNKYPSLAKFCINYSYHPSRIFYYKSEPKNDIPPGFYQARSLTMICTWEFLVNIKTIKLKSNFTVPEFGDYLACQLISAFQVYNDSLEQQRFYYLINHVIGMASVLNVDLRNYTHYFYGENLTRYIDTIINKTKNYTPKIPATEATISHNEVAALSRNRSSTNILLPDKTNDKESLSLICLKSPNLLFICNWRSNIYGYQMVSANLTYMSNGDSYSQNITLNTTRYSYQNKPVKRTIAQDKKGEKWIEVAENIDDSIYVLDIRSKMFLVMDLTMVKIFLPKELFEKSTGFMVDEFKKNENPFLLPTP